MSKTKIIAVSYTNTLPFIYGLEHSGFMQDFNLELQVPAICAQKLKKNEADIGLIPIAALQNIADYKIVTDYCLGTNGPVKTVLLLSKKPINQIKEIHLDNHSKTSVNLVKILTKFFWKKDYQWKSIDLAGTKNISNLDSIVAIGDKTFELKSQFPYVYDLSEEWNRFTGLPFVFACWISLKKIDTGILNNLNKALEFGVENINEIASKHNNSKLTNDELLHYLTKDMNYIFDKKKKEAMHKYFEFLNQL